MTQNRRGRLRRHHVHRQGSTSRRGAALVETAITIMVCVTLIAALFDFGLLVLKHHLLAQAARQLARQAIVHGDLATELGTWGPGAVNVMASDAGEVGTIVRNNLVLVDPGSVSVQVQWIDGGNSVQVHDRVRVTVTSPEQLMLTQFFGDLVYTLTASSTMPIAH